MIDRIHEQGKRRRRGGTLSSRSSGEASERARGGFLPPERERDLAKAISLISPPIKKKKEEVGGRGKVWHKYETYL